jgi:acyl-CoA synthetase (AMP-forming)/AMP-acid ligase II
VVLVQLPNVAEAIVALLACARLGCLYSPVATQFRDHELRQLLARARPNLVLTFATIDGYDHAGLWRELCRDFPALRLAAWGGNPGVTDVEALAADGTLPVAVPGAATPLTLCWTSGTEGRMKGVVREHRRWLCFDDAVTDIAALPPGATLLNPFPVANLAAYVGFVLPWLATAGTLVMHHPYSLPVFAAQLGAGNVDFTATPPALLALILQREEIARGLNLSSLRAIGSGGGPLAPETMAGFKERYGVDILNLFGSTEGGSLISGPGDVPDPRTRATCFPRWGVPGLAWASRLSQRVETRLVDAASGADVSTPGQPGELRFRGPGVFAGYYGDPGASAQAFDEQGYYRSGDLFEITGEGGRYYRFVGRLKNLVVRGGTNIAPEEIENLLAGHPAIAEVAVVGYPDAVMGEKLCAMVVPRQGQAPDLAELRRFLVDDRKVAGYKAPERLVVLERLPRNAMGKVLHSELRRSFVD